jgi:hypothetical protein
MILGEARQPDADCDEKRGGGRLWLTVARNTQHTTHSDRWLCLYLVAVAASIANRQPTTVSRRQQRRRTWPWCLVLWWGVGTCRRERRDERVTCLSCVVGGEELEKDCY